jgi:hypothetical protein
VTLGSVVGEHRLFSVCLAAVQLPFQCKQAKVAHVCSSDGNFIPTSTLEEICIVKILERSDHAVCNDIFPLLFTLR